MNDSVLYLKILLLVFLVTCLIGLYFYMEQTKAYESLKRRIQVLKGKSLIVDHSTSLRHEVWFSRFLVSGLKDVLRQMSAEAARKYRLQFEQAGWNSQDAPLIGSTINIGLILIGFTVYMVLTTFVENFAYDNFLLKIIILLVILLISLKFFEYIMNFIIGRRHSKIRVGLSYAIDLMGICTRSGYGLEKSFEKIAEEMGKYNKELCKEFGKTSIELAILPERSIALRNLGQRVDMPIIQVLVSGLIQAEEQGAPLGNTLRIMSVEFSKQKMLEIEAKAAKLPAYLTLPLVLFLLPALLIVLLGPAINNIQSSGFF
ncbi:MAG: type II secretion system F family protein [Janthinobacterium lividum]